MTLLSALALFATSLPAAAKPAPKPERHTHGPDPIDPRVVANATYAIDTSAAWSPSQYDGQVFTSDAPDLKTLPQVHGIYVYPSDKPSRFTTFAAMFQADARKAGRRIKKLYGLKLRPDNRAGGYFDITVVKSAKNASQLSAGNQFAAVRDELVGRGFNEPNKKYIVWLDAGSSFCGQADLYHDTRRSAANHNELSSIAVVYRPYSETRPDGGFCRGRAVLHELGHALGALQKQAPNAYDGAHCDDSAEDPMCYTSATSLDTGEPAFDYANDDYWDPAANPTLGSNAKLGWWTVNLSGYLCPTAGCGKPNTPAY